MDNVPNHESSDLFEKGDIIEFTRNSGSHWGIYLGHNKVAHVDKDETGEKNVVEINKIEDVPESSGYKRNNTKYSISNWFGMFPHKPEEIVLRALNEIGNTTSLSNREFVDKCRYGSNLKKCVVVLILLVIYGLLLLSKQLRELVIGAIFDYQSMIFNIFFVTLMIILLACVFSHMPGEVFVVDKKKDQIKEIIHLATEEASAATGETLYKDIKEAIDLATEETSAATVETLDTDLSNLYLKKLPDIKDEHSFPKESMAKLKIDLDTSEYIKEAIDLATEETSAATVETLDTDLSNLYLKKLPDIKDEHSFPKESMAKLKIDLDTSEYLRPQKQKISGLFKKLSNLFLKKLPDITDEQSFPKESMAKLKMDFDHSEYVSFPTEERYSRQVFKDETVRERDKSNWPMDHLYGDHETQVSEGGEADLHKYLIDCRKNPDHRLFIPVDRFTLKHLPEGHHDNDLYELIKVTADLTVRVDVKMTSENRPEFWPDTKVSYPFYNMRDKTNWRTGSGMVGGVDKFTDGYSDQYKGKHWKNYTTCWCKQCQHSNTANDVWWEFEVNTATQVVFDGIEASHTSLRLFYDREDSPMVSVDQVSVFYVNIESDVCRLSCVTCDKNLGDKLNMLWRHYFDVWRKVYFKYRESRDVDKLNFIVSHPHGCSKQVSVGHWEDIYKVGELNKFTYKTCTCPGSSGASVYCVGYGGGICVGGSGWWYQPVHSGSLNNSELNYSGASRVC